MVGMQLCTMAKCGYDAAIERFTATGEQAVALEKQLSEPRQLAAVIGEKEPKSKIPPPKIAVEDFGSGNWSGVHVTMKGGAKSREVNGYVVSQRNKAGATFIVVIAANGDIAKRLVAEATQQLDASASPAEQGKPTRAERLLELSTRHPAFTPPAPP